MNASEFQKIIEDDIDNADCLYFIAGTRAGSPYIKRKMSEKLYSKKEYDAIIKADGSQASEFIELQTSDNMWSNNPILLSDERGIRVGGKIVPESVYNEAITNNYHEFVDENVFSKGIDAKLPASDITIEQALKYAFMPIAEKGDDSIDFQRSSVIDLLQTKNFGMRGSGEFDVAVLIEIPKSELGKIILNGNGLHIPTQYIKNTYRVSRDYLKSKSQIIEDCYSNPGYIKPMVIDDSSKSAVVLENHSEYRGNSFEDVLPDEIKAILDEIMPREDVLSSEEVPQPSSAFSPAIDEDFDDVVVETTETNKTENYTSAFTSAKDDDFEDETTKENISDSKSSAFIPAQDDDLESENGETTNEKKIVGVFLVDTIGKCSEKIATPKSKLNGASFIEDIIRRDRETRDGEIK